ncbi:MAG: hypothetical protein IT290_04040, partial [Deltaproteobacteria bacterium]|nr:hypothetical protein [Deltaproteobacteria bacterium]
LLALADFEGADTPEPAVLPTYVPRKETSPALNQFLSYLVFSSHSARFAVELICCLGIFAVLQEALPFVMTSADWTSLTAWFIACLSVSLVDHFMLIPPFAKFREACGEDAMGHHERAVELLDSIGPSSGHRVALPEERYQLTRAVFELHAGNAATAREALEKAREAGLSGLSYMIYRLRISRLTEGQKSVAEELRVARTLYPQSGTLAIEEALGLVETRTEFRKGMKIFGEAIALADETHPFGVSTRSLARAFNEVCRLWSGYAEDAIEKLSDEISVLAALCATNELARPLLSQLFLERAYYFATHAEPENARKDLRVGEILCRHSFPKSLATKVRGELAWRYPEQELPALA